MLKTTGYSIWLMPEGPVCHKLQEIIRELSLMNESPCFKPHVTLIGELIGDEDYIMTTTQELAKGLKPFNITMKDSAMSDRSYKAVHVNIFESPEIMEANKKAKEAFHLKYNFTPHLSLAYCQISDELARSIEIYIRLFDFEYVSFPIDKIHLFKTEGEVKDWKEIATFYI
ncbi:2'-5' RNA ligase family protein [Candidatus Azambacteria bacterium]|nr:2'-5' RNA ligase family protein [Candidatus Azambacteria bacterium]